MKNLKISVSGVRGIVGDGLTPDVVLRFAQAYGSEFGPGTIVVGRDSRLTGEMLQYAVWSGLMSVGCDVLDVGVVPTPTVELAVEAPKCAGGIIITASHNPKEWNALKMLAPDGLFLNPDQGQNVLFRVQNGHIAHAAWDRIGSMNRDRRAVARHLKAIVELDHIDVDRIRGRRFRIVADPCRGAGGTVLPQLFDLLGCEAHIINAEPDGRFPRSPEPVAENLDELCRAVREHGADLGIAVDPDVDRLHLVSEKGEPIGEEYTLALAVQFALCKRAGDVVVNVSTSRVIDEIATSYGGRVSRTPVGEIHVASMARTIGAVVAGEGNGGIIYPPLHLGRDAVVGIALILQHLAETGRKLSEMYSALPRYVMIKTRVELPFEADAAGYVKELANRHKGEDGDTTDGIKFFGDRSWVHIRASNTEPIIRVIAEAPTREQAEKEAARYVSEIERI